MNSVAFELLAISVRWYGILIASGILLAIIFVAIGLKRYNIYNEDHLFRLVLFILILGFIGARLYYVIFNIRCYNSFWEIINIRAGGLAFHGGIISGLITIIFYCRRKKLDTLRYLDIIAIGVLLAQSIGRWGNFFNQEAHGSIVSQEFIDYFPKFIRDGMYINGFYYHPTFLYESINNLIWFVILAFFLLKFTKIRKGTFIALALIGNSATRAIIENLRTDSLMLGEIRVAVLISVVAIFLAFIFLFYIYTKNNNKSVEKIVKR